MKVTNLGKGLQLKKVAGLPKAKIRSLEGLATIEKPIKKKLTTTRKPNK